MKKIVLFCAGLLWLGCQNKSVTEKGEHYELRVAPHSKATLLLFPCFPCDIAYTKTEAKFLKDLDQEGISTLLMDFNQKLYLSEAEKKMYTQTINRIFDKHQLDKKAVFIGGFSSGGNVSLLLANHLLATQNALTPKGVFAIDSPVDVEQLYWNAKMDLKRNSNSEAIEEGKFIIDLLEKELGKPEQHRATYEALSPYTLSTQAKNNLYFLKDIKTRFYYEPALEYHKKDSGRDYEELNAYQLEQMHKALQGLGAKNSECVIPNNRGYRADGSRNPHTWNLVEREGLIKWILE